MLLLPFRREDRLIVYYPAVGLHHTLEYVNIRVRSCLVRWSISMKVVATKKKPDDATM